MSPNSEKAATLQVSSWLVELRQAATLRRNGSRGNGKGRLKGQGQVKKKKLSSLYPTGYCTSLH